MVSFLNKIISYSFYILFFLVPLAFTSNTSELFEFNKMWLTFALAIIIISSWLVKMLFERKIRIQRTPLDIPILLFLASQFVSTVMSLDTHTSLWGYYSRFNGGFLSLLTYALLYYAFVTNVTKQQAIRYLFTSIASGIIVSLWGLPSHFGYDPTCLVFRGTFDVSCWTESFQPKVRIFSTLGQPDWLSAYLAALLPLSIGVGVSFWNKGKKLFPLYFLLASILFYIDFLYAKSRGGFVGLILSLVLFFGWFVWEEKKYLRKFLSTPKKLVLKYWYILVLIGSIGIITFIVGTSFDQVDKFTLPNLISRLQTHPQTKTTTTSTPAKQATTTPVSAGELGGTDSGKIRLFVWSGAIEAWKHYPIFGTGVETFAYAYYLFMPPGHNMTSEFGYLYNKAHNEYLNYLATTGIVGLGTYFLMIGASIWFMAYSLWKVKNNQQEENNSPYEMRFLHAGLLASYIGILIINFFGFSVVIINLFLFLFPGFVLIISDQLTVTKALQFPKSAGKTTSPSALQMILSGGIGLIALYCIYTLLVFWNADKAYALGQNYANVGDYQTAYQPLHQAVQMRQDEPVFQDELSLDDAVLAAGIYTQDKSQSAAIEQLSQEALTTSNMLITIHPNIVTFWKTRVKIMYALAQTNPKYMTDALTAIEKASELAPTDAKVSYNLGLIQGQTGHLQEAITTLENTIKLKSNYHDAYYALGLFYHSAGVSKTGVVTNADYAQKAIDEMHFILQNFNPKDQQALDALKAWGAQ